MRCLRALALLAVLGVASSAWVDVARGQGPGGMILTIQIMRSNPNPKKPTAPINNLKQLMAALGGCWNPPPVDKDRRPADLNFIVSFKRSGELFGKPRAVIFARPVSEEERQRYYKAVGEALDLCSQMPFTDAMGGAVAGRTFQVRFIDMRNDKQA